MNRFLSSAAASLAVRTFATASLVVLASCGGGGGTGGGDATPPPVLSAYPTLVTSASFSLPAFTPPVERATVAGTQKGRALVQPGVAAGPGLLVQWLDASVPAAPTVLGTTTTGADGSFTISASTAALPVEQWLRVTLADGSSLRAFASGSLEVTPGTEATVRELTRLQGIGAFKTHVLSAAETAAVQESATLAWAGSATGMPPAAAADALVEQLRYQGSWNRLLGLLALAGALAGAGDVPALMPYTDARTPSTVTIDGTAPQAAVFNTSCFRPGGTASCGVSSVDASVGRESYFQQQTGLIRPTQDGRSNADMAIAQVGELPIVEFPYVPGSRELYRNSEMELVFDRTIHADVKVTRRTYPLEAVEALGGTVQAVKIVFDFEVAVLDTVTRQQDDVLLRETRWLSPGNGRVRFEQTKVSRSGPQSAIAAGTVSRSSIVVVADSVTGTFSEPETVPLAGVLALRQQPLRHRHAVYSPALDRLYVAVPADGGQVLEMDPSSLAVLRTLPTGAVPGRLAVSADGTRLYVGMDGGAFAQWRIADLSPVFRVTVPADPYGEQYTRIYDIDIDPFDAERVVLLAGGTAFGNSGALLVYRQGVLRVRNAPRFPGFDYGWAVYSPNAACWSTTTRDEFIAPFLGSPMSVYRFRVDEAGGSTADVSSLVGTDDVGWREVGGAVLTPRGRVLDAVTFAQQRALSLRSTTLAKCTRQDPSATDADMCKVDGGVAYAPPIYVRLDHRTSAFLGTYSPPVVDVRSACSGTTLPYDNVGLGTPVVTPMDTKRSLVSAWEEGGVGEHCNLQVWTFPGAP